VQRMYKRLHFLGCKLIAENKCMFIREAAYLIQNSHGVTDAMPADSEVWFDSDNNVSLLFFQSHSLSPQVSDK